MRLYYLIWVDCILRAKSQPDNKNNWQVMTMIFMTVPMTLDFFFVVAILERYIIGYNFYEFTIPIVPQSIAGPLTFAILYVAPPLAMNYLLIFRDRRYEKLIKQYEYNDGKLAVAYILLGLFVPVIVLWIGIIFFNV